MASMLEVSQTWMLSKTHITDESWDHDNDNDNDNNNDTRTQTKNLC